MNPVPVQIETCTVPAANGRPLTGVCGTCTKCGAAATAALPDEGGPVTRRKEAVAEVLAVLTEGCKQLLPWGLPPVHTDRRIPKGVRLFAEESHAGRRWSLAVNEKGKLETVAGGCATTVVVLVVPAGDDFAEAASDFARELIGRGYTKAQAAPAEVAVPQ